MKLLILATALFTQAAVAAGEDPLTVRLHTADAQRFAGAFTAGKTSAAELQAAYLSGAGRGVAVFTPHRIQSAENLAAAVKANAADYAHAIRTCLPLAESLNAELRAVYLAYRGLLPELPLPAVHLVFGAANSGGTAAPDAQVIGLEVMCRAGTTPEQFRAGMRAIFAHETVHSWQRPLTEEPQDLLLFAALMEGTPDLLARLVTGRSPSPEREAWARGREAEVWRRFEADRALVRKGEQPAAGEALGRWFGNVGRKLDGVPEGWPSELGYWVGMNIGQALLDRDTQRGSDPRATLRRLIANERPAELLDASGYAPR
jgi:hypothetical protein